jgi:mannose/fructose/N-acetylgalactosamine-specific phosphotransferase system component IIC
MQTVSPVLAGCATALLLGVLGGIFFLAYHGTVTGGEAMTIVVAIVGIAGGAFSVHSGVNAGSKAASGSPPPQLYPPPTRLPE